MSPETCLRSVHSRDVFQGSLSLLKQARLIPSFLSNPACVASSPSRRNRFSWHLHNLPHVNALLQTRSSCSFHESVSTFFESCFLLRHLSLGLKTSPRIREYQSCPLTMFSDSRYHLRSDLLTQSCPAQPHLVFICLCCATRMVCSFRFSFSSDNFVLTPLRRACAGTNPGCSSTSTLSHYFGPMVTFQPSCFAWSTSWH